MRICSVERQDLRIPLREPLGTASGAMRVAERGLLRVRAGQGPDVLEGWGEVAAAVPHGAGDRLVAMLQDLDPADPPAIAGVLERLDAAPWAGRLVRSAVSSAISDLLARAQGRSLAAFLGGEGRASVVVNGLIGRLSSSQAGERASVLAGQGFGCLKVKGGGEPVADIVERVAAVRAAAGPAVSLRLDLNGTLETSEAESVLSRLEAFHLEYVEQPLAEVASVADLARLRRRARVPIAADESLTGIAAARALLDADAVDALVVKPARVGGLAEAAGIVELTRHAGIPVTVSTLLETGVGLAGALHVASLAAGDGAHGLATAGLLATDLLAVPLDVDAGRMAIPQGTGLGVALDRSALERWSVA
jgi:L-alanine-DL-glutamate epimerase-like enolase superfamily enzyme